MKYSVDLKMEVHQKAKHLLLGNSCDNCYYHENPYRPASVFCIRREPADFGSSTKDFMDFIVNEGICSMWHDCNISPVEEKAIHLNCDSGFLVRSKVDSIIKILEGGC